MDFDIQAEETIPCCPCCKKQLDNDTCDGMHVECGIKFWQELDEVLPDLGLSSDLNFDDLFSDVIDFRQLDRDFAVCFGHETVLS